MPNVNFKFDADSSKVERAIKRLGTEFEKVVNTGDNIDKTLIDFGALVDKNADKVQNLKSEMQKLNAVNLQNMATQFERINAGGFNELIQGLRNVQTGVVGTENSIENLITKLGLSKNSIQQVANLMREALGNMGIGSAEYTATLSQLNILEQALGRIDQTVTASASNTVAANQNKITSTQSYMNSIRVANDNFKNELLSNVSMAGGLVNDLNMKIMTEAANGMFAHFENSQSMMEAHLASLQNYSTEVQNIINDLRNRIINGINDDITESIENELTPDEFKNSRERLFREALNDLSTGKYDPQGKAFTSQMRMELDKLLQDFMETGEGYEKMIDKIRSMTASGVISVEQLADTVQKMKEEIYNPKSGLAEPEILGDQNKYFGRMTKIEGDLLDKKKLDKATRDLAVFSSNTQDQAEIVKRTMEVLAGKTEEEVSSILFALQKLKQNSIIGGDQYKGLTTQIGVVNQEIQKTARANQALSGSSSSASMAITQMGFAIGDAGMITQNWRGALAGIGNNLPFIAQGIMEMNAAAKAAGTTGLASFGAALKGPAGILLGINAAIFALQILPEVFNKITGSAAVTTKAIRSNVEVLKELAVAMRASSVMGDESTRSTLAEGVAFKELTTRLQSTTANSKERKVVVDQIQAAYPEYIKNIDLNKASEKDLTLWVKNSTAALYGKIKAMLLDKLIEKNAEVFVEATHAYQKAIEDNELVKKQKGKTNEPDKDTQVPIYDNQGMITGYVSTKSTKQRATDDISKTKKDLDKATDGFKLGLTRATFVVESVMKRLGIDPGLANTDPDALKDMNKELKGDKSKNDEYTALEKLNDMWDKIIAQETDADKLAGLRYAKAVAIWDLSQKVLKTAEERNKAEIAFINAGNEYNNSVLEKRKKKVEELFKDASKQYDLQVKEQKESEQFDEEYIKRRVEANEKLKSLVERTATEGLSEAAQLEHDLQKELHDVEVDEFGDKEARKTEIQKFYAKKRLKIEKDNFRAQLSAVGDFLGATSNLFMKNTLAYKGLAVAQATMDTWKAANIALASPLGAPWNYIEMATAIATGIGNVANIIDTQVTGYAVGGIINKPTMALMGEAGPEIIAPVRDFQSYSRELIQSAYGGMGGGKELSVTVKGSDLVFTLQKATKKVNRQKVGGSL